MTNNTVINKENLAYQYDTTDKAKNYVVGAASYDTPTKNVYYECLNFDLAGKKVLDLGCGGGEDLFFLHQEKQAIIYGIDSAAELVKIAQNKNKDGIIKVGHINNIPFEDNIFDVVVSKWVFQHVEEIEPVYKEIIRVLKPGGRLIYLSASPIRQFLEKKGSGRNYFKKEMVETTFHKGVFSVIEPSHTLVEYLSPFFLNHFTLELYEEGFDEAEQCEKINDDIYPIYILVKAVLKP